MNFDAPWIRFAPCSGLRGNAKAFNEIIDDPVKVLLKSIKIVGIADFISDPLIDSPRWPSLRRRSRSTSGAFPPQDASSQPVNALVLVADSLE